MENLITTYKDDDDTDDTSSNNNNHVPSDNLTPNETLMPISEAMVTEKNENSSPKQEVKEETEISTEMSEDVELTEDENLTQNQQLSSEKVTTTLSDDEDEEDDANVINSPRKKRRSLASFTDNDQLTAVITSNQVEEEDEEEEEGEEEESKKLEQIPLPSLTAPTVKKPKKKISKANSVWTKPTSRKGKKKNKSNGNGNGSWNCNGNNNGNHHNVVSAAEDTVLITPIPRFPDKNDDSVDMKICLSKVYKAEKVELTDDRVSAGSSKGYRMVRATRGVVEGAWYFEIKVVNLGETGHTRLGWSTDKGDLQAPVGYDGYSFGYRDVDGSIIHKALREKYGEEGYVEGDVIGCYINLPQGGLYAPKPVHLFWYKGQKYSSTLEAKDKEEVAKVVPGSEICFFKNGIFQGVAFKDLPGGRYYPAASMYTLPNQPNCVVRFNFGPDFEFFPQEFEDRPIPTAMIEVPYQQVEARVENGESVEK